MSHAEEIARRLAALKTSAQDFSQFVNLIDGNFESKIAEIKNLEFRREKLREEIDESTRKAQAILQEASVDSSNMRQEALKILGDARLSLDQSKIDKEEVLKLKNEANALLVNAAQRQKEADLQYKIYSDKLESLKKAVSA